MIGKVEKHRKSEVNKKYGEIGNMQLTGQEERDRKSEGDMKYGEIQEI